MMLLKKIAPQLRFDPTPTPPPLATSDDVIMRTLSTFKRSLADNTFQHFSFFPSRLSTFILLSSVKCTEEYPKKKKTCLHPNTSLKNSRELTIVTHRRL